MDKQISTLLFLQQNLHFVGLAVSQWPSKINPFSPAGIQWPPNLHSVGEDPVAWDSLWDPTE